MDSARYAATAFGRATREPGNSWAFTYYLPNPIPRDIALTNHVAAAMSEADAALGRLQGLGHIITNPAALIGPYLRREAVATSRIEGTQASLSDLLRYEASLEADRSDVSEVRQYL